MHFNLRYITQPFSTWNKLYVQDVSNWRRYIFKHFFLLIRGSYQFYSRVLSWYTKLPGGGVIPLFGLYGYAPLDRVWFVGLAILNRVYNLSCLCPKQVFKPFKKPVLNRVWYYEPRDFNPNCEQSLSFLSLRPGAFEKLKELAIERRTSDACLLRICIISTEQTDWLIEQFKFL